jgi:hypothetical protein
MRPCATFPIADNHSEHQHVYCTPKVRHEGGEKMGDTYRP